MKHNDFAVEGFIARLRQAPPCHPHHLELCLVNLRLLAQWKTAAKHT
jgi:hypothetical protein